MRFEFFVASRYLRAKRRQAVVGVITAISIMGVAAGVASLILALAITNGMQRDLQKGLLSSTAQVQLMRVANDGIEELAQPDRPAADSAARHRGRPGPLWPGVDFARSPIRRRAGQRHSARRRAHRQQPAGRHQARNRRPARAAGQIRTPTERCRRWCSAPTLPIRLAQAWATACWSPARRAS